MKVLFLNTAERTGGAAVAANRLAQSLRENGIGVDTLVLHKQTSDRSVVSVNRTRFDRYLNWFRFCGERLVIFLCNGLNRKKLFAVSIANTGTNVSVHPLVKEADVIHLHWVNQGFLSLADIRRLVRFGKPVVWTLHDMWPCTSICHHAWGCDGFQRECGNCPFLDSKKTNDLSRRVWKKKRFLRDSGIQLVAVSRWLAVQTSCSSLTKDLDVQVIPNVIDGSVFVPQQQEEARHLFSLPQDKKIVMMGAARLDDPIKGFSFLKAALAVLAKKRNDLYLVLFGSLREEEEFIKEIPVPYQLMGVLTDMVKISKLYAAADVTVVPSFYETFGQTLSESMACGCPVVSFDNSGQTDVIDHRVNGYLARYKEADDLAAGIEWVLDYPDRSALSAACVAKVRTHYSGQVVSRQYLELYRKLLEK